MKRTAITRFIGPYLTENSYSVHTEKSIPDLFKLNKIFNCKWNSQIDSASNRIPFDAKSIGKVYLQSKFGSI